MLYDWTRYWTPEEDEPDLRSGFLVDPEQTVSPFRRSAPDNDSLASLSEIEQPCAVLLGEPGIGKSTEVEKLHDQLQEQTQAGQNVLKVELGMIVGYSSLQGELIEAPEVQAWKRGEAELTLILDALDECGMERVTQHLENDLLADPRLANNLTLRITCRSSDWPESLN
jgi:predicted ATPase